MTAAEELYHQVTSITENYLGPAAERFVARQISYHLDKNPHDLTVEDLPKFIEWAKVTFGLLTEDRRIVDEYTHKLSLLGEATSAWPGAGQSNHAGQSAH